MNVPSPLPMSTRALPPISVPTAISSTPSLVEISEHRAFRLLLDERRRGAHDRAVALALEHEDRAGCRVGRDDVRRSVSIDITDRDFAWLVVGYVGDERWTESAAGQPGAKHIPGGRGSQRDQIPQTVAVHVDGGNRVLSRGWDGPRVRTVARSRRRSGSAPHSSRRSCRPAAASKSAAWYSTTIPHKSVSSALARSSLGDSPIAFVAKQSQLEW